MIKALLSATISLAILFQGVDVPNHAYAAIPCAVAGGKTGTIKYSGQVTSTSAKICAVALVKKVTVVKTVAKKVIVVKKTTTEAFTLASLKTAIAVAKKVIAAKKAVVAKPITVVTKAVVTTVSTTPKVTTNKQASNFTATPSKPSVIYSGDGTLNIGESASFSSSAGTHTRNSFLLGFAAQVTFTPVQNRWSFGADGSSASHSWSSSGTYSVTVTTSYSVKYRIVGKSAWISLPGLISSTSAPVTIHVGADAVNPVVPANVLLVHWNCTQKLSAIGC